MHKEMLRMYNMEAGGAGKLACVGSGRGNAAEARGLSSRGSGVETRACRGAINEGLR